MAPDKGGDGDARDVRLVLEGEGVVVVLVDAAGDGAAAGEAANNDTIGARWVVAMERCLEGVDSASVLRPTKEGVVGVGVVSWTTASALLLLVLVVVVSSCPAFRETRSPPS